MSPEPSSDYASACLLSYQRPAMLDTCITSLLETAGAKLELIVHDDGSTDPEVHAVLRKWQERGVIQSLILQPPGHNEGVGRAINRSFALATGDPLIKIDQDLVFRPNWLFEVNRLLAAAPEIGLLSGFKYWHDPCDWRQTLMETHEEAGWEQHSIIMGSFMAIRRECYAELGPLEEHSPAFAEDNVFQHRVTGSDRWVCGTPIHDLMVNDGYGIGPSTVVIAGEGGVPEPSKINTGPRVLDATEVLTQMED